MGSLASAGSKAMLSRSIGTAAPSSRARDGHAVDAQRWRGKRAAEDQVVADGGDFLHRVGQLAVLDPQPGSAAGVVTGHKVGAKAHEAGHIKACWNRADDLF